MARRWTSIKTEAGSSGRFSTGIFSTVNPEDRAWSVMKKRCLAKVIPWFRPGSGSAAYSATLTGGIVQVVSMIEGGVSSGQYIRSMRMNLSFGAGSQFDSFSAPGLACWI